MNNFIFENKTKVYFGKGGVKEYLGSLLVNYGETVMLAYGGGSMKNCSDRLCLEQGLHITEKGKTFDGREREETTSFKKDTYQLLKQAQWRV